jgi:dihydrofolate reductase
LEAALERCRERNETKAFIIGGAQIFEPALRIADEMLVTEIDRPGLTGDTYFPEWDRRAWRQADVEDCEGLRVTRYERVT